MVTDSYHIQIGMAEGSQVMGAVGTSCIITSLSLTANIDWLLFGPTDNMDRPLFHSKRWCHGVTLGGCVCLVQAFTWLGQGWL